VFPSHKNIIEILFHMIKRILEEFVLPYVNAIFSITTFDLWINKGTLDNFAPVIFFNIGLGTKTCHN